MQRNKRRGTAAPWLTACTVLTICLSARAAAQDGKGGDPRRDTQIWSDNQVTIRLRPDLRLGFAGAIRVGRDNSAFINEQVGIGLSKSFGNHLSAAVGYRYINSEPAPDRHSREHRVYLEVTPRSALGWGISVLDRNRIERRDINDVLSWRYRNRLQFERPVSMEEHRITPYIAGEAYYDARYHAFSRTQVFAGARVPVNKHVTFDGFYMRQFDAKTKPGFLHVIGAYWRFEL